MKQSTRSGPRRLRWSTSDTVSPSINRWISPSYWHSPQPPLPVLVLGDPAEVPAENREGALFDRKPGQSVSVCSILVVDDEATILQSVSEALAMAGYQVLTARNGAEALALVEDVRPNLVLLDLRMPVMDGWEFVRVVRQRQLGLKIVVMTATTDARGQAEALAADAFLAKPFGLDQLMDLVERFCGVP